MKIIALLPLLVLFSACSTAQYDRNAWKLEPKAQVAVLSLENYSESSQAGIKAASMIDRLLGARGTETLDMYSGTQDKNRTEAEILQTLSGLAERNVRYAITGSVNEWKYKAGLEGEPTISLTLAVRDTATGRVLWSAAASRTGNSCQSTGLLAQKTLNKLLNAIR